MADVERLINAIDAAESTAYGGDQDGQLSHERALALDYYYGRNVEPAPDGRSQVSDRTVFETVQWILPSLCRIFANGDDVVAFAPFGPEDEEGAKQEGDYLNYLITQRNPWFTTFATWAQDALQLKNGYCLAYMESKLQTETESYEKQSDEQVTLLTQDEGVEVVSFESFPDTDSPPVVGVDPSTGLPMLQPKMLHNITIRRVLPQKRLRLRVLPPERCKVAEQTPSFSLEDCDYFEFYDDVTISSLRAQGFEVPDDILDDDGSSPDSDTDDARNLYDERQEESTPVDPSMRLVRARMIWIRHDYDEDGIAELQKVLRVGRRILDREEASRIPVACIVPNINSHRHPGTSLADMVVDIQRIKTAILRQGLDNLYLSNNPRNLVSSKVNLDDFSISAPGYQVRMLDDAIPAEGHVVPIPTPFVFPQAMEAMAFMEQVTEGRTGVSRAFSGVDPAALNPGNSSGVAINQLSTMAAQRVEQIARIIATGVEYLFSVAHELVIKSGHQKDTVKLRGRWVEIDPSTWKTGRDMRIVVGYGAGNKDALVSRLMMIANIQKEMLMGGLPTVTPQNIYETAIEITKASDFSAPQRFFTDPDTVPPPGPPQPSPDVVAASQVELEKTASNERVKAAEIQSQERVKAEEIAQKDRQANLNAELQIVLKQMERDGTVDVERLRGAMRFEEKAVDRKEKDDTKSMLQGIAKSHLATADFLEKLKAEVTGKIDSAIQSVSDGMNAPREVVRDKAGKVTGVKVGGVERKVVRDKDGRVSGLQ